MAMITRLLIANRGEIACRIARTAHRMGIGTVAVHSDADRRALHVELADEAVPLGGLSPAESYLRADALLDAAARTGCDAVHPGYGFLAENAAFARACVQAGLTFVGPGAEAIAAMGDKLRAKELMRAAGVPVLDSHTVAEADDIADSAYPLIVKAALGGGGKGMRVVETRADLAGAIEAARRESAAAFGDDTVFIERFLDRPRHIEVQILADHHGQVVHLGERECSIQRRHQKIIEESPSPAVDGRLRASLGDAALAAARAIGYRNAGTVEFVLGADGAFSFLEVNTRLQVEHPVTEAAWRVRGAPIDLVRLQLEIAAGAPLRFGQQDVSLAAHAIEARLYAEDPANDFLPAAGRLALFEPGDGVRIDTGVRSGDEVSVHYDPMIAKVIAAAPTRGEAAAVLARALERSRVHGLTTNRDFLAAVLRHPAFLAGELDTGFIQAHMPVASRHPEPDPQGLAVHAAAAALCGARRRHRGTPVLRTIPPGWRNNRGDPQQVAYRCAEAATEVGYAQRRDGSWQVTVDGRELEVHVMSWPDERDDGLLDAEFDARRLRVAVVVDGGTCYVDSPLGHHALHEQPRFPSPGGDDVTGGLVAPMPGTVASVEVEVGQDVDAGDLLAILEAMKMEHRITAPHAGRVSEVRVAPGDGVDGGTVLIVVTTSDGD